MRKFLINIFLSLTVFQALGQETAKQKEFDAFISNLKTEYIYYQEKQDLIDCIEKTYRPVVDTISHPAYKVLFYENILNEFYDSHINLNRNTNISYRLSSPIYIQEKKGRFYITSIFASQLVNPPSYNVLGAEIISFNGIEFQEAINAFPTHCHDKQNPEIREWLANKILAGKLHLPRKLKIKLMSGEEQILDIDDFEYKNDPDLLTVSSVDNVGVIRINNSLGNTDLIEAFDQALKELDDKEALILDLRNTADGGNTQTAEPIIGRFISEKTGYQVCENKNETYTRYAYPRGELYNKPLYVLVGRWTGSMGEGMTIGFDGMNRATIVGTEMNRLAGGMKTINLLNEGYGYRISFEKMYHLNGELRETFIPKVYVKQKSSLVDEHMNMALKLIKSR